MNQQEMLIVRGIELKIDRLLDMMQNSASKNDTTPKIKSEWITLKEACEMHGGYKLSTLRARLDLQPKCGQGVRIGTNKCWTQNEISEWLNLKNEEERKIYRLKYMGGNKS